MTEIRAAVVDGGAERSAVLLNQQRYDHRAAEVMVKDVSFSPLRTLLCESEVIGVPEERAGVNPLLGVTMHLCS